MEEQRVKDIVEKFLQEDPSLFLVDVKIKGNSGNQKVLIFIDGDMGLSIDQCSKISRQVGAEMEEVDFMDGKYTLEVSSPGLDHPITLHRQYVKNIGRMLKVEMSSGDVNEGKLEEVTEDNIKINNGGLRAMGEDKEGIALTVAAGLDDPASRQGRSCSF